MGSVYVPTMPSHSKRMRPQRARQMLRRLAAVVLLSLLCATIPGCEYTYEETRAPLPTAPTFTDPTIPRDPAQNRPVSGDELKAWVEEVLLNLRGQVFHTGSGLLAPGETKIEKTVQLPAGSYVVTLACRSTRQVAFVVQNGDLALVDLRLQCGTARVNVVQLAADSILSVTSTATRSANYAFRVSRI